MTPDRVYPVYSHSVDPHTADEIKSIRVNAARHGAVDAASKLWWKLESTWRGTCSPAVLIDTYIRRKGIHKLLELRPLLIRHPQGLH
jgi:hypothetical protein